MDNLSRSIDGGIDRKGWSKHDTTCIDRNSELLHCYECQFVYCLEKPLSSNPNIFITFPFA